MDSYWTFTMILLLGISVGNASEVLLDAGHPESGWRTTTAGQPKLQVTSDFAEPGNASLLLTALPWLPDAPMLPGLEKTTCSDWSNYDRLVLDFVNAGSEPVQLGLLLCAQKQSLWENFFMPATIPAYSDFRWTVPLDTLKKRGEIARMEKLHLYVERPISPVSLYLTGAVLLAPGEELAPMSAETANVLKNNAAAPVREELRRFAAWLAGLSPENSAREQLIQQSRKLLLAQEESISRNPTRSSVEVSREMRLIPQQLQRQRQLYDWAGREGGVASESFLCGFAPVSERIYPGDLPFEIAAEAAGRIEAAANERESLQLVLHSLRSEKCALRWEITPFRTENGVELASEALELAPIGSVRPTVDSLMGTLYRGWYPDVVLREHKTIDIMPDRSQALLLSAQIPAEQRPGVYRGTVRIYADEHPVWTASVEIEVFPFALSPVSQLPLAITTSWPGGNIFDQPQTPEMGRKRLDIQDFLRRYYLVLDNFYRESAPDFALLEAQRKWNILERFCLFNCFNVEVSDALFEEKLADLIARIRPVYEEAKRRKLLEYAYFYGFDERRRTSFPQMNRVLARLRLEFPEVPFMTTALDEHYGCGGGSADADIFVPQIDQYDPIRAKEARAKGKKVWWYICCIPLRPYPNMQLESELLESRMLTGFLAAKMQPDGFLYYETTLWHNQPPISGAPECQWNTNSFGQYNLDGVWFYRGDGILPLPSLRLENFRDGLDDYAYWKLLQAAVDGVEASSARSPGQEEWLQQVRPLLEIPPEVVRSSTIFARELEPIRSYRNHLVTALKQFAVLGKEAITPSGKE